MPVTDLIEYTNGRKYRTIYADPPWNETGGGKIKRGADRHYDLMRTSDIKRMRVEELISDDGTHLYLWVTNNHLEDGLVVMDTWGFRYVTTVTWIKVLFDEDNNYRGRMGLGQYYRGVTEQCLFGVSKMATPGYRKKPNGKRAQGLTAFYSAPGEHSEKPEQMREFIEIVSYPPRIELFARKEMDGWDVWGNEV